MSDEKVQTIDDIEARIVEDGHEIVAILTFAPEKGQAFTVKERVGRQIYKLSDDEQLAEMERVTARLRKKLQRKIVRENPAYGVAIKRGRPDAARMERLRDTRAQMAAIVKKRVKPKGISKAFDNMLKEKVAASGILEEVIPRPSEEDAA